MAPYCQSFGQQSWHPLMVVQLHGLIDFVYLAGQRSPHKGAGTTALKGNAGELETPCFHIHPASMCPRVQEY